VPFSSSSQDQADANVDDMLQLAASLETTSSLSTTTGPTVVGTATSGHGAPLEGVPYSPFVEVGSGVYPAAATGRSGVMLASVGSLGSSPRLSVGERYREMRASAGPVHPPAFASAESVDNLTSIVSGLAQSMAALSDRLLSATPAPAVSAPLLLPHQSVSATQVRPSVVLAPAPSGLGLQDTPSVRGTSSVAQASLASDAGSSGAVGSEEEQEGSGGQRPGGFG
jgi:hypothetical protein